MAWAAASRVDRVDGAGEQHRVARLAGPQAQRDGQMRLAQADAADEHDVAGRLHEPQPEQVHDLFAVDLFGPGPVEGVEGFFHREAGQFDAPGDGALAAQRGFALDEAREQRLVIPLPLGGPLDEVRVVFADERQAQRIQIVAEGVEVDFGGSFHYSVSFSRWRS